MIPVGKLGCCLLLWLPTFVSDLFLQVSSKVESPQQTLRTASEKGIHRPVVRQTNSMATDF